jgi:glutamate--cysteine ligase
MINKLAPHHFQQSLRGLEKENLRVTPKARLSKISHEAALNTSANDPHYTLDFAECQLEVITRPHKSIPGLFTELRERYQYVYQHIRPELLWPNSMPPHIKDTDIQIAHFGNSAADQIKERYREGLIHRYGKMMQVISGIHYNFSLAPEFFKAYQQLQPHLSLVELQNEVYFKMIHYYLERYWLLLYLFGASPIAFENSLKTNTKANQILKPVKDGVYLAPYATSIRQSDLGYHNPKSCELMICFQDLACYIETLAKATQTPFAAYQNIPPLQQLNANYLQIENEFYAPIRPKQPLQKDERPLDALKKRGVAYVEVRVLDINPFLPFGVAPEQLAFIELMLLTGLLYEKDTQSCESFGRLTENALKVSLQGRDPHLHLNKQGQEILLTDWARIIIKEMQSTAEFLQNDGYQQAINFAKKLIIEPQLLASAQLAQQAENHQDFMLTLAQQHQGEC